MDTWEELADCLRTCGVGPEDREEILARGEAGGAARRLRLLDRQRAALLEDLHRAQRRLDLMDLLIDALKKGGQTEGTNRQKTFDRRKRQ